MPKENGQNTEIIDLINPDFECELLANIPARSAAVGGFLQNHPLICGGKDDAWNCFQVKIEKKRVRFWTFLNMSIFFRMVLFLEDHLEQHASRSK